jgi:hypothetical protein
MSAHTQIVGDPLAYAFGVVVVEVGGDCADDRDENKGRGREDSHVKLRVAFK